MGCFDTLVIHCPHCNELLEEQDKPGYMNYYRFGDDPVDDIKFLGYHSCYACNKAFTVEFETVPKLVIKKADE